MINDHILEGTKNMYLALRRLCLAGLDIESYRMGKDGMPVIVLKDCQRDIEKRIDLEQTREQFGEFYRLKYFGVSIVWRMVPDQLDDKV